MFNYLFYRFSQIKVHKPTYWAKIFTPVLVAIAFLPSVLTLSKYFFGCYNLKESDGTVKAIILGVSILIMLLTNFYYSESRVNQLVEKYSRESKLQGNLKLFFICVLLLAVFWYSSTLIRMLVNIPDC
jgi:succinate dehydrogenase hydrophobic anchor subunit